MGHGGAFIAVLAFGTVGTCINIKGVRMTTRRKKIPALMLLLAAGLLFSSCFTVAVESDFAEDGSARHVYQATVDREAMGEFGDMAEELDPSEDFDESEQAAREQGYEVERIDTDTETGIRLIKTVEDNENLGQVLNDIFTAGGDDEMDAFSGNYIRDGNTHRLNVTISDNGLLGDELEDEGISPAMLSGFFTMTYTVRMPGTLNEEETNGRILEDGRVQWDIPLTGAATFIAVSETEGDGVGLLMWGILGVLLLAFVGSAVLLAVVLLMRNRRATETAQSAPVATSPYAGPDAPTAPLPQTQQDPANPRSENY
jgi:hypothetical protein